MTIEAISDKILGANREVDFLLPESKAHSRFEEFNHFSISNRIAPYLLEDIMPSGVYRRTEYHRSINRKGHIGLRPSEATRKKLSLSHKGKHNSPATEFKKGMTSWCKGFTGSKSRSWKGGRIIDRGYILIYKPNHPSTTKNRLYVYEHRFIMERHLRRYLTKEEVVHHINGIKGDNRIKNLILASNKNHIHTKKITKFCCPKCDFTWVQRHP